MGYSGDFNFGGPAPDPKWTFTGGVSSADVNDQHFGDLRITIDPSTNRGCWVSCPNCPRLLESPPSGDFQADNKLDTLPPLGATDEHAIGILAYQDVKNYLRFELQQFNSTTARLVAAHKVINNIGTDNVVICRNLTGLTAPFYLWVARSGNNWTLSYSTDGTSYTTCGTFVQAINLTGIGLPGRKPGQLR